MDSFSRTCFCKGDFYAHLKETDSQTDAAIETKEGQFVVAVEQKADSGDVKVDKKVKYPIF